MIYKVVNYITILGLQYSKTNPTADVTFPQPVFPVSLPRLKLAPIVGSQ